MTGSPKIVLELIRMAIASKSMVSKGVFSQPLLSKANWYEVKEFAMYQGVFGIIFEAIENLG